VKRGRGRPPRKEGLVRWEDIAKSSGRATVINGSGGAKEKLQINGIDATNGEETHAKRARGRPRKDAPKFLETTLDSTVTTTTDETDAAERSCNVAEEDNSVEQTPSKRSRGRPRKVTWSEVEAGRESLGKLVVRNVDNDDDAGELTPSKRPRGRPRKETQLEDENEDINDEEQTPSSQPRGRPRKDVHLKGDDVDVGEETPSKRPRGRPRKEIQLDNKVSMEEPERAVISNGDKICGTEDHTPSKRPRGRPPRVTQFESKSITIIQNNKAKGKDNTPVATPTKQPRTPSKPQATSTVNADRSARRKSARNLIERTIAGDLSDDNGADEEAALAKQIYDVEESEEEPDDDEEDDQDVTAKDALEAEPTASTPSKRGPGRPKGRTRKKSPTPPADLPPHEQYFYHNRPGKQTTSSATLSSLSRLTHSSYQSLIQSYNDPHKTSISFLHTLHARSFPQWAFELSQNYSICLYGYGSKRQLLTSFADYLDSVHPPSDPPTTIIINGFHATCTPTLILTTLASAISPPLPQPLPQQPATLLPLVLAHLTNHPPPTPIYTLLSSLDASPLRRPATQSLFSSLASHPSIHFLATCDQLSFPLLWDPTTRSQFNFLFRDATTFVSYDDGRGTGEVSDVVGTVAELMGRKGGERRGREGVGWVLRSLPENGRGVFRVLVGEILAALDADSAPALNDDDASADEDFDADLPFDGDGDGLLPSRSRKKVRKRGHGGDEDAVFGVEYKALYQKAVEEFLCSSEMAFRTLLKEFHDHRIIVTRRGEDGSEVLGVPMRREEVEGVLEDLVG
jgi:origin recognition complex subunit 2